MPLWEAFTLKIHLATQVYAFLSKSQVFMLNSEAVVPSEAVAQSYARLLS